MAFLRMRKHAKRPVAGVVSDTPETLVFRDRNGKEETISKPRFVQKTMTVVVNGQTFVTQRAANEYQRRLAIHDARLAVWLATEGMKELDGALGTVMHGKGRNASRKPSQAVRVGHYAELPDTCPEGFEDTSYEHSGDTVRKVRTISLHPGHAKVTKGAGGQAFWDTDTDRKLRKNNR